MKQPFTAATLRAMFEERKIIKGKMKLPSADGFRDLATIVNVMTLQARGPEGQFATYRKKLNQALALLDDVIPGLCSLLRDWAEFSVSQAEITAMDNLGTAAKAVKEHPNLVRQIPPNVFPPTDRWHGYGECLLSAFLAALRTTNEDEVRFSNKGPAARFMKAAIGHISVSVSRWPRFFGLGQRRGTRYFDQRQGSRVSIWRIGWSAMRLRTSAR